MVIFDRTSFGFYLGEPLKLLNIRHILPFTTPFIIGAVAALDMAIYKEILSKADSCYVVLRHKVRVTGD